MYIKYTR